MSGLIANDEMHDLIAAQPSQLEVQVLTLPAQMFTDEHREYLRRQEGAKAYVFNRLTLPIIDTVRRCRTVREVLRKLDDEFRTCSYAMESMARRNFYSLRYQDYNDMHQFLAKFQHYADCLMDAGHTITDHEKLQQLISALPKEYDVTVLNYHVFSRETGQSYNGLKRMLLDAYERDFDDKRLEALYTQTRRLNIDNDKDSAGRRTGAAIVRTPKSSTTEQPPPKAAEPKETSRSSDRSMFTQSFTCHKCGGLGHRQAECPSQLKPNETTKNAEKATEVAPVRPAVTEKPSSTYEDRKAKALALMVTDDSQIRSASPGRNVFMLDSGAFTHMCSSLDELNRIKPLPEPIQITTASANAPLYATHAGEMLLEVSNRNRETMTIFLDQVLYVPGLPVNLLAENRITQSQKLVIEFTHEYADIVDRESRKVLFSAYREGTAKYVHYVRVPDKVVAENQLACPATTSTSASNESTEEVAPETQTSQLVAQKWLWHRRLGHVSGKYLRILIKNADGIPSNLRVSDNDFRDCRVCAMAKSAQLGHTTTRRAATRRFDIVSSDVLGPFTPGRNGEKFVVTFVDNFTNFVSIALMKKKSEVAFSLARFHKQTEAKFPGTPLHILRADCAKEYVDGDCNQYCGQSGITIEDTSSYAPQLNGVAERTNRTVSEKLRALLFDANLEADHWTHAIQTAVYLMNRLPCRANPEYATPFELWHDRKPAYTSLRVFGCIAERYIPPAVRSVTVGQARRAGLIADTKLCPRSERRILVGFTATGYQVLDPATHKITSTCDVRFDETRTILEINEYPEKSVPVTVAEDIETDSVATKHPDPAPPIVPPIIDHPYAALSVLPTGTTKNKPLLEECVPTSYADIARNPYADQWKQAVATELTAMMRNAVFTPVKKMPHMKLIDSRWLFTIKYDRDGNPFAKARLVARGFRDQTIYCINETYSPVVNWWLIRWAISIANKYNCLLTKYDVSTAFLNADLRNIIFLAVPEGMTAGQPNTVLELKKSIYGLKPSSKNWYDLLHDTVLTLGFKRSHADRCLYYQRLPDSTIALLLLYVDDMLLVTQSTDLITRTTAALKKCFQITIDEDPKFFVGFEIHRDIDKRTIALSQTKYVERILRRFNLQDAYPQATPMDANLRVYKPDDGIDDTEYRSMIGALLYVARGTRPDIAYAVNALSKAQTCSTDVEKNYVRRIFRYLAGTRDRALVYYSSGEKLDAYVDASYAPNISLTTDKLDLGKGKSISGYLLRLFEDPILWAVKQQTIIATSSTAAEVIALFDALDNVCVARHIMLEIFHLDEPVTMHEDNTSATQIVMGGTQKNMRSTLIKCYALLEAVENREVAVKNVPAKDQIADGLTKPLDKDKFLRFVTQIFVPEKKTSN